MDLILPYKVGDLAESKSFLEGYRGAWFRSKIIDMRVIKSGHLECYLDYIDYPDENNEWIRPFQKNPACPKQQSTEEIMLRPSFPQWYLKDQVPQQLPDNDVIAIVYEFWKVGDMVDWLSEGCYWSARITKLLNKDMVEVELLQPPLGEGQCYKANRNALRPTLDWSLVGGWTVPLSQAKRKGQHVVCVIHRKSTGSETRESREEPPSDDGDKDYNGGADGDSQDVQHVIASQAASGSQIPKPSSAAKTEEDARLTSATNLKPSSAPKSQAPTHGTQPDVSSSQLGIVISEEGRSTGSSTKQDQAGNVGDEYMQKLDEFEGRLQEIVHLARLEDARNRTDVLAALRWDD